MLGLDTSPMSNCDCFFFVEMYMYKFYYWKKVTKIGYLCLFLWIFIVFFIIESVSFYFTIVSWSIIVFVTFSSYKMLNASCDKCGSRVLPLYHWFGSGFLANPVECHHCGEKYKP